MPAYASLPHHQDRRSFLWSLASVGITGKALALKSENNSEIVYRFTTPECEVQMSVEYFGSAEVQSLRFRDFLSRHAFCLSPSGEVDSGCIQRFSGALAIAHYRFHSHLHGHSPLSLRERVLTIDYDRRLDPRPPFEKHLAVEGGTVSDIQAFGYNPDAAIAKPLPLWCLLRQDLFLNDNPTAFLIVHWKHTFDAIHLLDVIPGDRTELISA
jgi:hypothetical protein